MNKEINWRAIEFRTPTPDDIAGIVAVVRTCEPYLTAHYSYIYWKDIHNYSDTLAVAVLDGEIVGWCSITPALGGKYFLHQIGIAPKLRRIGLAEALALYAIGKLKTKPGFELEFTMDQGNLAALQLFTAVAKRAGMQLEKQPDIIRLIEGGKEELFAMKLPATNDRTEFLEMETANSL